MAVHWLVHLLVCSLAWRLASTQQCLTDVMTETQLAGCGMEESGRFCRWEQGILRYNTAKDYSKCTFLVRDPAFLDIFTSTSKLEVIVEADAHEGGVYNPDDDCFYFSSTKTMKPKPNTKIMKLHFGSGKVDVVIGETEVANGMVLDKIGKLLVCHQGIRPSGGYIESLNLTALNSSIVVDNWHGLRLNSPNDVVVKSDGSIWFTDPDYGWVQGFGEEPEVNNQVYRVSPTTGVVEAVADGFVKPNGLAFSHDERVLYVTDTGSTLGDEEGNVTPQQPHSVTAFNLSEDGASLLHRRLFASISTLVGKYKGVGCPDGIKVDTVGRVYVANPDGIQVLNPKGKILGLIKVPGATNMGFAGEDLDTLIILNDTAIHKLSLYAQGAGLHYANHKLRKAISTS